MIKKEIICKSIDYIIEHIGDEMTVKDVAEHFYYSEAYFSRAFKAVTGESIYHFIKHIKIDQSAIDIKLKKGKTISEIALEYGYSSSNYSSAFKLYHNLSPSLFRENTNATVIQNPFHPQILNTFEDFNTYDSHIKVVQLNDMKVIFERVFGSYDGLKEKWCEFFETYKSYIHEDTLLIERFFDDPTISYGSSCVCDLCATTDEHCTLENTAVVEGGKFAVYRFEGEIKDIFCSLQGVFSVWFPRSGYEMNQRYGFNIYRSINTETGFVVMDLCIPIK